MKVKDAIAVAMGNEEFVKHFNFVAKCIELGETSPCLVFVVDGEFFGYGFDGFKLYQHKYSEKASNRFSKKHFGLVIR